MRKRKASLDVTADANENDRQFITSLHRGLEVLRAFRPDDRVGLSNGDLTARTGLPNSTVSRLTFTLLKSGYLLYDNDTGRYNMGVPVLSLGYACLSGVPFRETARGYMQDLADACGPGVQVALGSRVDYTMIYLACARSRSVLSLQLDVGSQISLGRSAMGRAYLAACPEDERNELLGSIEAHVGPDAWPSLKDGIQRAADQIEDRGFYANHGEWQHGVSSVAVPFTSPQSSMPMMSFNLGGPSTYLPADKLENDFGPKLVELAKTLSQSTV
jgi:DNA-binding IclR family transcriptional regulator